jgi:hypothetical protein
MNLILDFLLACALLGLPMVVASWFLFSWLFGNGSVNREMDRKTLHASLKKVKKKLSAGDGDSPGKRARFIYDKWMWFGSGFYGLAGLWTFAVIEIGQFFAFMFDAQSWSTLLDNGLISFLISFALNQLGNMLQGLVWFTYWPADSMLLWVLVAYLGYWLGVELARRSVVLPQARALEGLAPLAVIKSWWQRRKQDSDDS